MLLIGKEGEPDSSSIARERCRSSAASSVELCTVRRPRGGEPSLRHFTSLPCVWWMMISIASRAAAPRSNEVKYKSSPLGFLVSYRPLARQRQSLKNRFVAVYAKPPE